jgi:hypothetical protein
MIMVVVELLVVVLAFIDAESAKVDERAGIGIEEEGLRSIQGTHTFYFTRWNEWGVSRLFGGWCLIKRVLFLCKA